MGDSSVQLRTLSPGASSYIEHIRSHSLLSNRKSLFTNYDYQDLLKFVSSDSTGDASSRIRTPSPNSSSAAYERADGSLWILYFKSNIPRSPTNVLSTDHLNAFDGGWQTYNSCGHLILLKGYPSAHWLKSLGSLYRIDAEFWRRHLDYLGSSPNDLFAHPYLPSGSCEVFKLRITTVGSRLKLGSGSEDAIVKRQRSEGEKAMTAYSQDLRWGAGWRAGDSVVRGYTVYDSETFSIDQAITICLNQVDVSRQYWQAVIYTDCGRDLSASSHGPWLGDVKTRMVDEHTNLLPLHWHVTRDGLFADPANIEVRSTTVHGFAQNTEQLHLDFGRMWNHEVMCTDPFYAMSDVFKLASVSESKFLNMIASKLDRDSRNIVAVDFDERSLTKESLSAQSNLIQHRQVLEDRMQGLRDILSFIRRQHKLETWSALEQIEGHKTIARRALAALEYDFEHLYETANILYKRCEGTMLIAMNNASIAEARRSQSQAKGVFKFTVLASVYVPLSFTSTFMGMNVKEFNNGSVFGIWLFWAMTLPVFGLSVLYLFVDWRRWLTVLRGRLHWIPASA